MNLGAFFPQWIDLPPQIELKIDSKVRRGGRAVEGARLEIVYTA